MKSMVKVMMVTAGLFLLVQALPACCGTCGEGSKKAGSQKASAAACQKASAVQKGQNAQAICLKCGQIKGSALCCKPGQKKCPKCGLVKGSPGCCKIPQGAKKAFYCPKAGKVITSKSACPMAGKPAASPVKEKKAVK